MRDDGIGLTGGRLFASRTKLVQLREGAADAQRRACKDCAHLTGYVSWWCTSPVAREARGTSLPGIRDCQYWEAPPLRVPLREKARKVVDENGLRSVAWRIALLIGVVGWFGLWLVARGCWR